MSKAGKPTVFRIVEALTPQLPVLIASIRESATPEFSLTIMGPDEGSVPPISVEFDGFKTRDGASE